ncbi:MAG: single-stranded DNA-binding protein [Bacillota bacterium]|nr:single-stranded DNA-binding protein [Bacillota bacterium]
MLNRVVLIGRLTRDPELRFTQSGIAVATFTLAVDRNFKNASGERETDFIDIVVWRQQAENCANYLSKGKLAAVDGSLRIRSYEAQDGSKRKAAEVVADNVRFLSPKDSGSASASAYGAPPPEVSPFDTGADRDMVGDDDLPF